MLSRIPPELLNDVVQGSLFRASWFVYELYEDTTILVMRLQGLGLESVNINTI